jgi:GntR family transcriptional regulator of vanillate catabolism
MQHEDNGARTSRHQEPMSPEAPASQTLLAARRLRELILSGDLEAGQRLSEIPLSERVGVSRTPLRLAFARLHHEGLLEQLPAGGFVVRRFSYVDAIDAIELRGVLEGTAARLAAERTSDPARLKPIRRCCSELDEIAVLMSLSDDEITHYIELNDRFHEALVELAGSDLLRRAIQQITRFPFAAPSAFVEVDAEVLKPREWLVLAQAQHIAIVDAISLREGTRAESLAREHARATRSSLEFVVREGSALSQVQRGPLALLRPRE